MGVSNGRAYCACHCVYVYYCRLHVISSSLHCLQEVKVVQGAACVRVRYFELQSGKGTVTTFTTG